METAKSKVNKSGTESFIVKGYGATGALIGGKTLKEMKIEHHRPDENEVTIEVLYCGVCHSDIHQIANDWKNTIYPCVPGHEIIGRITEAGSSVKDYSIGDIVGVGCMIDSCRHCESCKNGEEQYCLAPTGPTLTYNGYFKTDGSGFNTFGGYSTHIVCKQDFLLNIPKELDIKTSAPILCAGITTYSPLNHFGVKPGHKVGVIGIGGLGHMGVMLAKAMGAEVTAITTKEEKRNDALALGADAVLISEDKEAMKNHDVHFDFLLCTIPYPFDVSPYVCLLRPRGQMVTVGLLGPYEKPLNNLEMVKFGRSLGGSNIGGIAETQEVLNFCAKHGIAPHVEMINIQDINEAHEKIKNEEVRFRYVIDMQSLKDEASAS